MLLALSTLSAHRIPRMHLLNKPSSLRFALAIIALLGAVPVQAVMKWQQTLSSRPGGTPEARPAAQVVPPLQGAEPVLSAAAQVDCGPLAEGRARRGEASKVLPAAALPSASGSNNRSASSAAPGLVPMAVASAAQSQSRPHYAGRARWQQTIDRPAAGGSGATASAMRADTGSDPANGAGFKGNPCL